MKRFIKVTAIVLLVVAACVVGVFLLLPVMIKKELVSYIEQHSDHKLDIGDIGLGWNDIAFYDVELNPRLQKDAFFKKKGIETDWIRARFPIIRIKGINWREILKGKHYKINYMVIDQADIYVYRDKRMPDVFRYRPLPSSLLREAKARFTIPVINLNNCSVVYEEVQAQTNESLTVSFGQLNAVISHLSSDNIYMDQNPFMTIAADALILDSIKAQINYQANTKNKTDEFTLKGHVHSFSATQLNRCIEPAAKTRIISGQVRRIDFSFTGNDTKAKGYLNIDYRDLKLKVHEEVQQNKIKTLLANFFVKNNDRKEKDQVYTGEIDFTRRKDRFIFNYWWNSFKSGIVSSVLKRPAQKAIEKKKRSDEKAQPDNDKQRKKHR